MPQVIIFPTKDGKTIAFESEHAIGAVDGEGLMSTRTQSMISEASETFEQAIAAIKGGIAALVAELVSATSSADEIAIEFGLKAGLKFGMCISGSTDAGITVKLTYKKAAQPIAT